MIDLVAHILVTDVPAGWATILAAVAGSVVLVIGPAMGVVMHRQTKRLRRIDEQVSNDHVNEHGEPINMRVEQDERHAELVRKLDTVLQIQDAHTKDIGGIRHDIRTLYAADGEQVRQQNRDRERLVALEKTYPRNELGQFTTKEKS